MKSGFEALLRKGDALAKKHVTFYQDYSIQKHLGFAIVRRYFRDRFGCELTLTELTTFYKKLTHRTLHCRDPILISIIDKVAGRDWLGQRGLPAGLKCYQL